MIRLFFTINFIVFYFSSCADSPNEKPNRVKRYFVHGDPMVLIQGSKLDNNLPSTDDFMNLTSDSYILSQSFFSDTSELLGQPQISIVPSKNERYRPQLIESDLVLQRTDKRALSFRFKRTQQELRLESLISDNNETKADLIHFSARPDKNMWSLLIQFNSQIEGRVLLFLVFAKKDHFPFSPAAKDYEYLAGTGYLYGWSQPQSIEISFCGDQFIDRPDLVYLAHEQLKKWEEAALYRVKFKVSVAPDGTYPPFSDLNASCVYLIDDYLVYPSEEMSAPGLALMNLDESTGTIADGDLFLFIQDAQKSSTTLPELFQGIFLHEAGHFLGLGHYNDLERESVMSDSYNQQLMEELHAYDREAIQQLYP